MTFLEEHTSDNIETLDGIKIEIQEKISRLLHINADTLPHYHSRYAKPRPHFAGASRGI